MLRIASIAILGLSFLTGIASAQPGAFGRYSPQPYPHVHRHQPLFHVQFRQPYWRDQHFSCREEMIAFVEAQQRNGWDVQIMPGGFCVRYRLMQWGGSRIVEGMHEAQHWSRVLESQGYETRIVPYQ